MSTFVGKIRDDMEARYVRQIISASGATERQFVRAALLAYCGMLMEKATQMRKEVEDGQSGEAERNVEAAPGQDSNSNTLENAQSSVVDTAGI